jgi:hypothetical protein
MGMIHFFIMEHDLENTVNMKLILSFFSNYLVNKLSQKRELFCKAKEAEDDYRTIFGCDVGALPFKYLGIPIHFRWFLNKKKWK